MSGRITTIPLSCRANINGFFGLAPDLSQVVHPLLNHEQLFAIRSICVKTPSQPLQVEVLEKGQSLWAKCFKVTIDDKAYVLRQVTGAHRGVEIAILLNLANMGVAPEVHYQNSHNGIAIMEFIETSPNAMRVLDDARLSQIAENFAKIHQSAAIAKRKDLLDSTLLTMHHQRIKKMLASHPLSLLQFGLDKLEQLTLLVEPSVLCHNDVHPHNVLAAAQRTYFIDMELAGRNDPLLDIALFAATIRLNSTQTETLLRFYEKHCGEQVDRQHFQAMRALGLLRMAMSFIAKVEEEAVLTQVNVFRLPNFDGYDPVIDGPIDMKADMGRAMLGFMLIKQAMQVLSQLRRMKAVNVPRLIKKSFQVQELLPETISVLDNSCEDDSKRLAEMILSRFSNHAKLEKLAGGLSPFCRNFTVSDGGSKYVVKLYQRSSSYNENEVNASQIAAELGVSPAQMAFDRKLNLAIYEFVENNPRWLMVKDWISLASLAEALTVLHGVDSSQAETISPEQTTFGKMRTIFAEQSTRDVYAPFAQLLSIESTLAKMLDGCGMESICHGDVNPWNALQRTSDQQVLLVDWEMAFKGNPWIDLATIANFLRLDSVQLAFMILAYKQGRVSAEDEQQYLIARMYTYVRYAICTFAINGKEEFEVDAQVIEALPPFQLFNPKEHTVDKNTAVGRYQIALMFCKAALALRDNIGKQYLTQSGDIIAMDWPESALNSIKEGLSTEAIHDPECTPQIF